MSDKAATSIRPLTSIRGFAALWVYVYHQRNALADDAFLKTMAGIGYFGVDIFFILSGFIISYVHIEDFAGWRDVKRNARRFFMLRLCRIYPLHLVTLLLFIFFTPVNIYEPQNATLADFIRNLFMVQAWTHPMDMHWNIPSWSISVEWLLYLCFPLAVCAMGAMARDVLFNALLLALSIWTWALFLYATDLHVGAMEIPGLCIPRGILDFTMGIALHNLYRLGFLKRLPWDALAVTSIFGFLAVIWLKSRDIAVHDIVILLLAALLIYALASIRSFGHYLFSNRVVVYLGTISYSFYMLHWFYLLATWEHRDMLFPDPPNLLQFLGRTLGLIAVSALSYHFFENPIRKWAHRRAPAPVNQAS